MGSILKDNNLEEYDDYKLLVMNHGRCCGENINISCEEIYEHSVKISLASDDLKLIIKNSCMDTSEVKQELNCLKTKCRWFSKKK